MKCRKQHRRFRFGYSVGARSVLLTLSALIAFGTPVKSLAPSGFESSAGPGSSDRVYVGQTIDDVIATLGKPDLIVDLGSRVIYVYKDRKIIFANGRVTDSGAPESKPAELPPQQVASASLRDVFSRETTLNSGIWSTGTALLRPLAGSLSSPSSAWITPEIKFTPNGLRIAGVSGINRFTGLQSNQCFNAPLTVSARVEGEISHGNPFELYLVTGDLRQWINLDGNLDPSSGYQGLWENVRKDGSSRPGIKVFDAPATNAWYDITMRVDATGTASVNVTGADGTQLVSVRTPDMGVGPFWIVLAQREGLPYAVGPNAAIWREVSITSGTSTPAVSPYATVPPKGAPRASATAGNH